MTTVNERAARSAVSSVSSEPDPGAPAPLVVDGLIKRFGQVRALDGVSLSLNPGELMAVVGPSGCGKSTLLRTVAGLATPDRGRVDLGGRTVENGTIRIPPEGRGVGLVFQEHALFPHLTVAENVGFGLRDRAAGRGRVGEMLELVGLPSHGERYPHELSGGERQRVALARALAPRPALMLFDEPFASIDHNLRIRLRNDLLTALRATGTPSLFVTHDQAEALAVGDRIAVMRRGRIVQVDRPAVVFHRPADQFVAHFMGEASFLPISNGSYPPESLLGPVEEPDPGPHGAADRAGMQAMVRPDDLRFIPDAQGPAAVEAAEYRGSAWLLTVRLNQGSTVLVAASHLDAPRIGARGRVTMVEGHRQVAVATEAAPADNG
jgi:iron(III) transport system ATP-binding protein